MREDVSVALMVESVPDINFRGHVVSNYQLVPPRKDVIRVTVVTDTLFSSTGELIGRLFPNGHSDRFTTPSLRSAQLLSAALKRVCIDNLKAHMEHGDGTYYPFCCMY